MLEGERSYQRGQENLVPSDNTSSIPETQVVPKAQEKPWYIQHFTKLLIGFGLGGGAVAILLPWMLWLLCGMSSGSSDQLRLHLLYVTGGIIAVLTLLQTNWKNQGDRLKIDADIKKNEQDAEKNERDHIRQVHAERRSRYTKAVEQLADEKAAVRLGGIYTLVGLVDEWLSEETLPYKKRLKEGQIIVNNLCAYIRSPLQVDSYMDLKLDNQSESNNGVSAEEKIKIQEEREIRQSLLEEIKSRLTTVSGSGTPHISISHNESWSNFKYDFSNSTFFYPVHFKNILFENSINFSKSTFYDVAYFDNLHFEEEVNFYKTRFKSITQINSSYFYKTIRFSGSEFYGQTDFYRSVFAHDFIAHESKFYSSCAVADSIFAGNSAFTSSYFHGPTNIYKNIFGGSTEFNEAEFRDPLNFEDIWFIGDSSINMKQRWERIKIIYNEFPSYSKISLPKKITDTNETRTPKSVFSLSFKDSIIPRTSCFTSIYLSCYGKYDFNTADAKLTAAKFNLISREVTLRNGKVISRIVPATFYIFDPDSWDVEQQKYTRMSKPTRPLDNSSNGEEDKSV
jgi:hypothetical protein